MLSFKDRSGEWIHYNKPWLVVLLTRNWFEMGLDNRFIAWDDYDILGLRNL